MRLLAIGLLLLPFFCMAQTKPLRITQRPTAPCSLPGMTPESAIAVCGATTFRQTNVTSCEGPPISGTGACASSNASDNAFWYKIHCYQAGTLGFIIKPLNLTDDFDWEVFDITNVTNLSQVYTNESLMVSLNLCGSPTGITGCTAAGTDSINCGGGTFPYNRLATLKVGHDYLLMVNNWSNSGQGYTLTFAGGTAVITNNTPPVISNVVASCAAQSLAINFSKDIQCSSVTSSGSEFTITPGTNVITGVTSQCAAGYNNITGLTINLQNPLPPGNYTLEVNPGSDGNTFADPCDELMVTGFQIPFTVPAVNALEVDTVTFTGCVPTVLDVKLTRPVWCSSVTGTGSEFSITPGNPAIASLQSVCTAGQQYTDMLHINLQNPLPPGNYQLVVNNGSDGNTFIDTCNNSMAPGYSFPFTVTPSTAPVIQSVQFDECNPNKVTLNFDKPVSCASITAAGSELSITPGVWPVSTVSYSCATGNYTTQIIMNLANPLPAGNFNVRVGNGTDGNTLSDTCLAFIAAGYSKGFVTTQATKPVFDSVQFDKCNPSFVKLFYSKPIKCASVSANGSDYNITGPSAVNITAAVTDATCTTLGYTNWVLLQFAQPVNVVGNYLVHNKTGTDGDGIIDTCNASQNTAETIAFNALVKPSAAFTSTIRFGCVSDTVVFSHPGGSGVNSWIWTFADGSTAAGQTVTKIYPVTTVSTSIRLVVTNGSCSDTVTNTITLDNAVKAAFTVSPKDTACMNLPVGFTNLSTGNNLQYLWTFGDNTQFTGANPPPHVYGSGAAYNIKLTITNNHGCSDVAVDKIQVMPQPTIDFTGLGATYCTGKTVALQSVLSKSIMDYAWDNGDGLIVKNKAAIQYAYTKENIYTVTLSGMDKYCGAVQTSKTVIIYDVPLVNLGSDTILCPGVTIQIGVPYNSNYTYLWGNGASSSYISTDLFTNSYSLTVNNKGCTAADAVLIKVLAACLIKIPNAFTPNGDGLNDHLYAMNADQAKAFTLRIYNRFGQLMFSTNNPVEKWDGNFRGKPALAGTYVWHLDYTDPWTGKKVVQSGSSILIR
ncbi:MAG: PKD domain-containing protein [Ferruginibacter sp.]